MTNWPGPLGGAGGCRQGGVITNGEPVVLYAAGGCLSLLMVGSRAAT
jgi:hypothetical protein